MGRKNLASLIEEEDNFTKTENDCLAYKSTLSSVLDFYSTAGAMRQRSDDSIIASFIRAWDEDPMLALKCLFYIRDVRGGQGERRTFRTILKYLANAHPEVVLKNTCFISHFGRWDDLLILENTKMERYIVQFLADTILSDLKNDKPSLLAKWIKNEKHKKLGSMVKKVRKCLGWDKATFRKNVSTLRAKLRVVESQMCAKEWELVKYPSVPSKAMLKYRKAYSRHDRERFEQYLEDVKQGKKKINAKTLFPYEIVRSIESGSSWDRDDEALDVLWDNLPNYVTKDENAIVLADTSGSMRWSGNGLPLLVSLSLAIYFAERNKGVFHNRFMGFSRVPTMYHLKGETIREKWECISEVKSFHENTDLIACFTLILKVAVENKVPVEEMPTVLYMISDMEFDQATESNDVTTFQKIDQMYANAGYTRPKMVFWNVNSRNDQFPVTKNESNVFLVSGCSPTIFKSVMESKTMSAVDLMLEVLNSDRYNVIEF